jgi:hypothetical protein
MWDRHQATRTAPGYAGTGPCQQVKSRTPTQSRGKPETGGYHGKKTYFEIVRNLLGKTNYENRSNFPLNKFMFVSNYRFSEIFVYYPLPYPEASRERKLLDKLREEQAAVYRKDIFAAEVKPLDDMARWPDMSDPSD